MNFNHSFNNLIQKVNTYNLRSFNFQFRIQNDSHFMGQNKNINVHMSVSQSVTPKIDDMPKKKFF